jgi:hypothetical protein
MAEEAAKAEPGADVELRKKMLSELLAKVTAGASAEEIVKLAHDLKELERAEVALAAQEKINELPAEGAPSEAIGAEAEAPETPADKKADAIAEKAVGETLIEFTTASDADGNLVSSLPEGPAREAALDILEVGMKALSEASLASPEILSPQDVSIEIATATEKVASFVQDEASKTKARDSGLGAVEKLFTSRSPEAIIEAAQITTTLINDSSEGAWERALIEHAENNLKEAASGTDHFKAEETVAFLDSLKLQKGEQVVEFPSANKLRMLVKGFAESNAISTEDLRVREGHIGALQAELREARESGSLRLPEEFREKFREAAKAEGKIH